MLNVQDRVRFMVADRAINGPGVHQTYRDDGGSARKRTSAHAHRLGWLIDEGHTRELYATVLLFLGFDHEKPTPRRP